MSFHTNKKLGRRLKPLVYLYEAMAPVAIFCRIPAVTYCKDWQGVLLHLPVLVDMYLGAVFQADRIWIPRHLPLVDNSSLLLGWTVLQLVIIVELIFSTSARIRLQLMCFELNIRVVQGVEISSDVHDPEKEVQTVFELVHGDVQVDTVLELWPPLFGEKCCFPDHINLAILINGEKCVRHYSDESED